LAVLFTIVLQADDRRFRVPVDDFIRECLVCCRRLDLRAGGSRAGSTPMRKSLIG
jgi:hypothetical protein